MIAVRCGSCETIFQVGNDTDLNDISGQAFSEVCPNCGAINQISPDINESVGDTEPVDDPSDLIADPQLQERFSPAALNAQSGARGLPGTIWWGIALTAVGVFASAVYFLVADNWEQQHLQFLVATSHQGDLLMNDGDFSQAASDYGLVLSTVGDRKLQSIYLQGLIDHSRLARRDALARALVVTAPPASAASSATSPSQTSASQPSEIPAAQTANNDAIRKFQRATEGLVGFLESHPILFQDDAHRWRRRQFLAWDITYQLAPQSDQSAFGLEFSVSSRCTEPHDSTAAAAADSEYVNQEFASAVPVQTQFVFRDGRWTITQCRINGGKPVAAFKEGMARKDDSVKLADLVQLQARAFDAILSPGVDPSSRASP